MKFLEIVRFEMTYQLRRPQTWLFFVILGVVAFLFVRQNFLSEALYADFFVNSPFIIASVSAFTSLLWILLAATVAGEAGARDVETGMDPLAYTAPVTRAEYLGGRFVAALALNTIILLAVPLGVMVGIYAPGVDARVVGPFRPAAYLTAFGFISFPSAFFGTSIQFAWAALSRRAISSYLGSVLLFFGAYGGMIVLNLFVGRPDLAAVLDVFGHIFVTDDLILNWTPIEKNTRLIALQGTLLWSRVLWTGIALATLAFTYSRFRFEHAIQGAWWSCIVQPSVGIRARGLNSSAPASGSAELARTRIALPPVLQTFDLASRVHQTGVIGWTSFRSIATSRMGLPLQAAIAVIVVWALPNNMNNMGTPLLPRTEYVLSFLTAALTNPVTPWVITPLLIVVYAGALVWRERQAGLGEIADATPVPDWAVFLGKLLGLGLVLVAWMALLTLAGIMVQIRMGYPHLEIGLHLKTMFGLQLPQYALFAVLALVIQGIIRQKYVGHFVALLGFVVLAFAGFLGVEHRMLVYGSAPEWSYTDMRGFGASLTPWRWFMLYWGAWALLLTVVARLLWSRGMESGARVRLRQARGRFTRPTATAAATAAGLVLVLGGFVFYNTNILNEYVRDSDITSQRAEYELRYGRYAAIPQPNVAGTRLEIDIHPREREVGIRGAYKLVNHTTTAIDSIHIATMPGLETEAMSFDRAFAPVIVDMARGHRVYVLEKPLEPDDSVTLEFAIRYRPRGFRNGGLDPSITASSTYFVAGNWLPAIGYQASRELFQPSERREHGLPERPLLPRLNDPAAIADITGEAGTDMTGGGRIDFEAIVSTDADQIAIAPGALRRSWEAEGRRYFYYATDEPIGNEYAVFSADYTVRTETWTHPSDNSGRTVAIEVYHHPRHGANLDRILRSVRASLAYYSSAYGSYPYAHLRLVESPGTGIGAHAEPTTINYSEGFSRFDPAGDAEELDLPFAVIGHEMAHEWGIPYAYSEGAALLTESFAWYAAMGVVEKSHGDEHLQRLLRFFRQPYPIPQVRQSVPLLVAMDPYAAYRKGPFALRAMAEYMGRDRVDLAFRRLIEKHRMPRAQPATSLDLYRELQAVTPDSLQYLVHDLFEANTYWDFVTEEATATQTSVGVWQLKLRVRARKLTLDPSGLEADVPMDEWVQIGVFGRAGQGADYGETLYLNMHRIRSGEQTIMLTVASEPSDAGIDPYHVLIEEERFDNVERVEVVE